MKISDILRQLAASIDSQDEAGTPDPSIQNPAELSAVAVPAGQMVVDVNTDNTDTEAGEVYLPPLQTKLELLKRAVGVDNVYDDGQEGSLEAPEEDHDYAFDVQQDNDELDFMRKAAGIKAVVMSELGDDEPLE